MIDAKHHLPVLHSEEAAGPDVTRRGFIRLSAAGLAAACGRAAPGDLVPHEGGPAELHPGTPLHYATSLVLDGHATGVVVRSDAGRPTKIEGNPDHPASLGATAPWHQAALYDLYDEARVAAVSHGGRPDAWEHLRDVLSERADRGAGLRLLLPPTGSPVHAELLLAVKSRFPEARVAFASSSPLSDGNEVATRSFSGRHLVPLHDLSRTRCILALDDDLLQAGPFGVRYARQFAGRRREHGHEGARLYVAEPRPSCTGSLADEHLACRPSAIGRLAVVVLGEVAAALGYGAPWAVESEPRVERFARAVAADLVRHRGECLVVAGGRQPPEVHVLTHTLNAWLAAERQSTWLVEAPRGPVEDDLELSELVAQMWRGEVDTVLIAASDPAFTLSAAGFGDALAHVATSVYWAHHEDTTARLSRFVVPAAHDLESWGLPVAVDGTWSPQQPLLEPLDAGRTLFELLLPLAGIPPVTQRELVRGQLARIGVDVDAALQRGVVPGTASSRVDVAPSPSAVREAIDRALARDIARPLEVVLRADTTTHAGLFAGNAWLQELPDPVTKLTWGDAFEVSPAVAERLGVTDGCIVTVAIGEAAAVGPIVAVPGLAEDTICVPVGGGRRLGGGAPTEALTVDASRLLSADGSALRDGATVHLVGGARRLPRTQEQFTQHGRALARVVDGAEPLNPEEAHLWLRPRSDAAPQWGMVVDLDACHGCSACVIACQVENSVPTVGPEDVARGREMHWLRIDRWVEDPRGRPAFINQPMACQHCEYAPCEYVCPTGATVHSPDGINEMIYNRCVGTRFCSNNCPYKVRRFNWFDYAATDRRALAHNPDVTVRARGVIEKCTYCVQRIRRAGIAAHVVGRPLRDGDVVTACAQACPTEAIVFGDLTDPRSAVARRRADPRSYAAMAELGTRPRTRYLAKEPAR